MKSIELIEVDLEPVLESCWILKKRIRAGFTEFLGGIWVVLGDFRGEGGE